MPADLSPENFRALLTDQVRVVSFDIFDTVVTRTYARPTDLFVALGAQLRSDGVIPHTPERFARLRIQAEAEACSQHKDGEPSLAEIVQRLGARLEWSESTRTAVLAAELALERESLRPLLPLVAWIEEARRARKQIVFVSDMYLSSEFLRDVLISHGIAKPADAIFVSNEHHASKATGALFRRLTDTLKIPASAILHVGDNEHSDFAMAQRAGLQTRRISFTQLGAIERSHLPFAVELNGLSGRLAAASRLGRINATASVSDPALCEIGSGLLGPMLTAFVLWSFQRARTAGLKRLYFVSRDGQVIREIALALQQRLPAFADIECRYLYGSRIAWHHASLTSLTPRHLRWLLDPLPTINAEILAHRLGIKVETLAHCLRATTAAHLLTKEKWGAADLTALRDLLPRCQDELLTAADAPARVKLARDYFEQEGFFDGTAWGIIELGWTGSMLTSLFHALGKPVRLEAYYLCQTKEDPELPTAVVIDSFLIQPGGVYLALGPDQRLPEMIEALTAADHPTTLGYEKKGTAVRPVLKQNAAAMWSPAALGSLRSGAHAFVQALDAGTLNALCVVTGTDIAARQLALQLLSVLVRFTAEPTKELAAPFAACSFSEDPADEHRRNFVEPVSVWNALSKEPFKSDQLWREGSLVCSTGTAQALIGGGIGAALRHVRQRLS